MEESILNFHFYYLNPFLLYPSYTHILIYLQILILHNCVEFLVHLIRVFCLFMMCCALHCHSHHHKMCIMFDFWLDRVLGSTVFTERLLLHESLRVTRDFRDELTTQSVRGLLSSFSSLNCTYSCSLSTTSSSLFISSLFFFFSRCSSPHPCPTPRLRPESVLLGPGTRITQD